ncbi:MAG TPA: hypothetical protein VIK04_00120, partial [Solirubrobacteraceae bacterium]
MAVPAALSIVVDRGRPDGLRLAAAGAMVAMLLTIGFTDSRGECSRSCWRSRSSSRSAAGGCAA